MTGPAWLPAGFAAVMIVTAAYCAGRVAAHRLLAKRTDVQADLLHVLMGVAMAGMFEPGLALVPGAIWRGVFAACAAWFGWQALRPRHPRHARSAGPVPHAVESAAMTYVFWSAAPSARPAAAGLMPGMTATAGNLALTVVLAVFMIGYILRTADLLASPEPASGAGLRRAGAEGRKDRPARTGAITRTTDAARSAVGNAVGQPALAPRLAACYKIMMSIAMSYMLITML